VSTFGPSRQEIFDDAALEVTEATEECSGTPTEIHSLKSMCFGTEYSYSDRKEHITPDCSLITSSGTKAHDHNHELSTVLQP
jgi:hypothetical protein